jgi:hypothetical protein
MKYTKWQLNDFNVQGYPGATAHAETRGSRGGGPIRGWS